MRRVTIATTVLLCTACGSKQPGWDWASYQPPDWRRYQAQDARPPRSAPAPSTADAIGAPPRITLRELKTDSDARLAQRILGPLAGRIAYIDRHRERWDRYSGDAAAESIELYTHPQALGSQFGLCGVERYAIHFDDAGQVDGVSVTRRYGVEGPIFQKADFDWNAYKRMCAAAPASHAPSYFPATDEEAALDLARMLLPAIDLAAIPGPLPYLLRCPSGGRSQPCPAHVRGYLATLRLNAIYEFSQSGCPLPGRANTECFTIRVGEGRLGSFPKTITVRGSTFMNNISIDSVDVLESQTLS
jgi:hypothetical protein